MVLVRRRDKRKGNAEHEIVVASDSSIVANKGVRSLQSARSGRFAADMRANVGGYGRPDKTWGVDHPWHQTREDLFKDLSARDRMEDGVLLKQEDPAAKCRGLSRAALKKKKAKMKKGGLAASSVASSDIGSEHVPTTMSAADDDHREQETDKRAEVEAKPVKEATDSSEEPSSEQKEEERGAQEEASGKKRKRTNRNKKKKEKLARLADDAGDISDDDDAGGDDSAAVEDKKAKKAKTEAPAAADKEDTEKRKANEVKAREALAKQYESACGQEFTTASGLVMRDVRIGQGRLPAMGEMLTVRYKGRLGDQNGLVFGKGMLSTNYGTGSVIAGWEEGMGTMRPGGIRHLTIPAELGYGASGKGGKIPPNSVLFFEVELVRIGKRKRDTIGKDDIPLPSAFQRKKIKAGPSQSGGGSSNSSGDAKGNGQGKRRRRKHSI
ncbi:hypothetical protein PINS_up001107 [Pythium insidiosum]|nr:hypothetical protein PINS_up001107 [Pythium insidiosum]